MMGQLLRNAPIEILEVGASDDLGRGHTPGLQSGLELDIKCKVVRTPKIRQRLRILDWKWLSERLQRFQTNDPGRNTGGEILRQERSQRLVLPRLNVSGAPIIHQNESENMIGCGFDWDRFA